MTIPYKCEECGASLNIKDELAGTKGRCPKCKASFIVPAAPKPAAPAEEEEPLEPAAVSAKSEFDSSDELTAAGAAGGLSDDDIEKLLESGVETGSEDYGVAGKEEEDEEPPAEKKSGERKITAQPVDEPDDDDEPMIAIRKRRRDDEDDEDDDEHADDELMHRKKKGRERTPAPPTAVASAGVARELMGRGEKGKEKKDEKRSTRPFGGRDREGAEEGFSKQEIAGQLLKLGGPVVALLLILFLGVSWYLKSWSRGELPELASVKGRVTLNGQPLPNALVQFHPQSEANQTKLKKVSSSNAYTDAQGNYELLYISDVPGAVLGKHRVQIDASDENGMPIAFSEEKQLSADVASGSNTQDFPLTSASPKK